MSECKLGRRDLSSCRWRQRGQKGEALFSMHEVFCPFARRVRALPAVQPHTQVTRGQHRYAHTYIHMYCSESTSCRYTHGITKRMNMPVSVSEWIRYPGQMCVSIMDQWFSNFLHHIPTVWPKILVLSNASLFPRLIPLMTYFCVRDDITHTLPYLVCIKKRHWELFPQHVELG